MILQELFRVVSRFPRYISCYTVSRKMDFLWDSVCLYTLFSYFLFYSSSGPICRPKISWFLLYIFFAMGSLLDCCLSPRVFHYLWLFYFLYLIYIFVLLGRMCCGNKLEERQSEKGGGGSQSEKGEPIK